MSFNSKGGKNKIGPHFIMLLEEKLEFHDYKYSKALSGYEKSWTLKN